MNASANYLTTQIQSATPSGLIVLLYDGLLRFASEAREELGGSHANRSARASERVDRCIRILTELNCSLRWDADPAFCAEISGLYTFFTDQLSQAARESKPESIHQILPLIEQLRDSWRHLDAQGATLPQAQTAA